MKLEGADMPFLPSRLHKYFHVCLVSACAKSIAWYQYWRPFFFARSLLALKFEGIAPRRQCFGFGIWPFFPDKPSWDSTLAAKPVNSHHRGRVGAYGGARTALTWVQCCLRYWWWQSDSRALNLLWLSKGQLVYKAGTAQAARWTGRALSVSSSSTISWYTASSAHW